MTITDLKAKVQKAEEAVEKREATLQKQIKQEAKRREALTAKGINVDDPNCRWANGKSIPEYWEVCDWESSRDAVKNSKKVLEDKIRILNTWKERLSAAEAKEHKFLTEIPESMKAMRDELVIRWDEYDTQRQERIKTSYREMDYREWGKTHTAADYQFMYQTKEQIHNDNVRSAEDLIINLFCRINAITGEVTDWANIHYSGGALNGIVVGKLGKVRVESILAGGYNIQRLHVRVLVHEI